MPEHTTNSSDSQLVRVCRSESELRAVLQDLRPAAEQLRQLRTADVLQVLDQLAQLWQPGTAYFQEATNLLAGPFSRMAIEGALTNLAASLNSQVILSELTRELGRSDLLDTWQADEQRVGRVRGFPLGIVVHVLAGNVFMNGVVGLAQCLLTRNAALLKLSRRDAGMTALFVRSLRQADTGGIIASAVQVCVWDRSQDAMNQVVREEADGIVVWGGEQAISAFPANSCRGRVIGYGPRLGIGFILEGAALNDELPALAWDVAVWEQQACSSPRIVFVEDRDADGTHPRMVAERLSVALQAMCDTIPPRELSLDDKSEVLTIRENAYWNDQAEPFTASDNMHQTVLLTEKLPAEIPVGYRTVLVIPMVALQRVHETLQPYRRLLQTAVLAAPAERWSAAATILARAGLTQIVAAGSAASRFLGLPHEGEYALRRLVTLVGIDMGHGALTYPDRRPIGDLPVDLPQANRDPSGEPRSDSSD